jgi:hypothetical protein
MEKMPASDEEIVRKIGKLMKNPNKRDEYIDSRADRALDNWPGRRPKKPENSAKSS